MKIFVNTLGCKVNAYESEMIKEKFLFNGDEVVTNESDADVIIVNTCTVTNQADSKSRKVVRQAKRNNESATIVVCGCASENHKNDDEFDADIIIGNKDKSRIVELVSTYNKDHNKIKKFYDLRVAPFEDMKIKNFEGRTRGFVKIQDGCNNFCSYCIIPFTRGNIRSKDINVAIKEINELVSSGYKEIVLTGIHTGSYGVGEDYCLVDLIREISKNDDLKRIRISSIEATELDDNFMMELKNNPKICDHLHIPIQSGSNNVLKNMNRKYDLDLFENIIKKIRSIRPNINITTDLIVGFPEESENDFNETINTLKRIGFSKVHTFPYSMRNGTKASLMKQVNDKVKDDRTHEVLKLSDELESEYYKKFIGSTLEVLVEDGKSGFTSNYIKVHLDTIMPHNEMVMCIIDKVDGINVYGKVLKK